MADQLKAFPLKPTPEMIDVLEFGRKQPAHNTYLNLWHAAPVQPVAGNLRESFEIAAGKKGRHDSLFTMNFGTDVYFRPHTQSMWEGWQLACAAQSASLATSDEQIIAHLATHGIGYIAGDERDSPVTPFEGEDAKQYIDAIRALLTTANAGKDATNGK